MANQEGYNITLNGKSRITPMEDETYNQWQGTVQDAADNGSSALGTYGSVQGTQDYDDFIFDYSEADLEPQYPETTPISPYQGFSQTAEMQYPQDMNPSSDFTGNRQNPILPLLFLGLSGGLSPYFNPYNDGYYNEDYYDDYYDDDDYDYDYDDDYDYEYPDYDEDDD
jgi:hypothetical protein